MSSFVPYNDARALLLAANLIPASRIHWQNEPFSEPSPPAPWLSVDAYSPAINMLDVGAKVYREEGSIRVMCLTQTGIGTDGVRTLAKSVCNVFRGLGPRNPYYLNASISDTNSEDGMWFALVVTIDFVYEDVS